MGLAGSKPGTGVVLLQMGGPQSPKELEPFLASLFSDPEMIRLPSCLGLFQPTLAGWYARYRARKVHPAYDAIGWSQLTPTTRSLASAMQGLLDGETSRVTAAMRYTPPRAREAVAPLLRAGVEDIVAVTLYPFYSVATTGSSVKDLQDALDAGGFDGNLHVVDGWGDEPEFAALTAEWTRRTMAEHERDELGDVAVLLSTHGVPQAYVDAGDPYQDEVARGARQLEHALDGIDRVELAFQSDVGPVAWLRPYVPEMIDELAKDGVDTLVIVPFGFVSEHVETLFEIDVEYRNHALQAGIDRVLRVPTFDDDPAFAGLLARLVREQLGVPP